MLPDSVRHNVAELHRVADLLEAGYLLDFANLRTKIWGVVKPEVLTLLHPLEMQVRIANHFESVTRLDELLMRHANRAIERLGNALEPGFLEIIKRVEDELAAELLKEARAEEVVGGSLLEYLSPPTDAG